MEFKMGQILETDEDKLEVAIAEAHLGLAEGGIPIRRFLTSTAHCSARPQPKGAKRRRFDARRNQCLWKSGTDASYRKVTLATTLSPCWYCSGLIRQFGIGKVIVGDDQNLAPSWVAEHRS
jgi:cytosine deaminase